MPLIRNRMTMTPKPTKIQISKMCEMPNILPPLSTAPNKSFNHKGHEGTRRKSRALPSCIFASFLDLPDCVQVVHDLFRFSEVTRHSGGQLIPDRPKLQDGQRQRHPEQRGHCP